MKYSMGNQNHSNHKTGNNLQGTVHNIIDDEIDTPEFINMTCKRCGKKHDMPYDIYMDMLEYQDLYNENNYLEIECIYCNKGIMIPSEFIKK